MKTNKDYILREIAGEKVLVASGEAASKFNGLITINDVAAFIWEHVDSISSEEELVELILEEYDIDEETARRDVSGFLKVVKQLDMVRD